MYAGDCHEARQHAKAAGATEIRLYSNGRYIGPVSQEGERD